MKNDSVCLFFSFIRISNVFVKIVFGVYVASTDLRLAKGLIQNYSYICQNL